MDQYLVSMVITGVGCVVWWLLTEKDKKRGAEIADNTKAIAEHSRQCKQDLLEAQKDYEHRIELVWEHSRNESIQLWAKHELDVRELQDLRERIAREHYVKQELDMKFDKVERAITDGLKDVSGKIDKLAEALLARREEDKH